MSLQVAEPSQTVPNKAIRTSALDVLRGLIKRMVVHYKSANGGLALEPEGAITAMTSRRSRLRCAVSIRVRWHWLLEHALASVGSEAQILLKEAA